MSSTSYDRDSQVWKKVILIVGLFLTLVVLSGIALIVFGDVLAGV